MYSSLLSISLISTIATLAVADNLFTDWTSDSNLGADLSFDSSNSNDANGLSFGDGADPGNQLLAFNDNGASNPFTADSSFQSTDLGGNQASTAPLSDDTTNWFLDSTPLSPTDNGALDTSFLDNLALPDLPNGSPDLLANNAAGGCSSFAPSSRRRRNTEQLEGACTAEGMTQAEFLKKGAFAQDAIFRTLVCPATDFGVTVPVCSSRDPQKSTFFGADSAFNPNAHTLADSNLSQLISIPGEVSGQLTVSLMRSDLERGLPVLYAS